MNISLESVSLLGGLPPVDAADTAAATTGWIDIRQIIGDIRFILDVGVVTAGTLTATIEDATDGSGTDNTAVTPRDGAFTVLTTSNDPLRQVKHIRSDALRGWVRLVGTIVTGPVQVSVAIEGRTKY